MRKGFTLLEILVAITLMITAVIWAMANFQNSSRKQKAIATSERIQQLLRQAKSNALAGKKEDCVLCSAAPEKCHCLGTDNLCGTRDDLGLAGWQVMFNTAVNSVSINGVCGQNTYFTTNEGEKFPDTISLSLSDSLPSGTAVLYKSLGRGAEVNPALAPTTEYFEITVTETTVGYNQAIRIYKNGEIQ